MLYIPSFHPLLPPTLKKNKTYIVLNRYIYINKVISFYNTKTTTTTTTNIKISIFHNTAMDPTKQFKNYGSLLWYMGMIDKNEKQIFDQYENKYQLQLLKGDYLGAFNTFDEMLNGDFIFPTYYYNVTGLTNYFNMEQGDCGDCQPDYTDAWLDTTETRNKIHVGDLPYNSFNDTVEVYLENDWMVGVTQFLIPLLESRDIKVLIYSGQNDVILGAPLTEQFLDQLEWTGQVLF
mmetsp:Transcript_11824/g.15239  ORF Transcript_11824/g.15239 Transcript_11824/m.15239 type:complete len:234 (+) Transcript_11824:892-1593(+)